MTDLRITQMPAAAPLTGTELLEMVQNGLNVQIPLSSFAAGSSQFALLGAPNQPINGGLNNQFVWATSGQAGFNGGGTNTLYSNLGANGFSGIQFSRSGGFGVQQPTGAGALLGTTVGMATYLTGAVAHTQGYMYLNTSYATVTSPSPIAHVRAASNGLPIAGFTSTIYFALIAFPVGASLFMGWGSTAMPLAASTVPSSVPNSIALSVDGGVDTNLQLIINNGSGSATKTDLGVTPASVINHLLRLVTTCDGLGNVVVQILDYEATGVLNTTLTFPTSTAKLPATNTLLTWGMWVDNNALTQNVSIGICWGFWTAGFGAT